MSRIIQYIENKKIIIVGMGREGKSTLSYIRKHLPEKHLTIADKNGFESDDKNITVISGEEVLIRDVTVNERGVTKRIYQSAEKWYDGREGQKEYFLLLSDNEYDTVINSSNNIIVNGHEITIVDYIVFSVFIQSLVTNYGRIVFENHISNLLNCLDLIARIQFLFCQSTVG